MLPPWIAEVIGQSRVVGIAAMLVFLLGRLLSPLNLACWVALLGGERRSSRAFRLIALLREEHQVPEPDEEGQLESPPPAAHPPPTTP
ncbi:hypothetical protein BJ973_002970 [Actinoplanes tereljensis]|uniref:Uncharacterized protein n=1 Tax=Paractinoplanes tereljensis TaxID=571912 RepID=A0A919NRF4_9ACTN|nr:hypothetical protein [Actinoplanes tereljensis]GIF22649.1 hypothetical protein Ate02nite_53790 [Actinoplanes tereljensis]